MTKKNKQYYIYIRSTKEKIPCTEQEFHDYYHDIDNYRRKQQRHRNCKCPSKYRLQCDMDCLTCPYMAFGEVLSLDNCNMDDNGGSISYKDTIDDRSPLIEDIISENERFKELLKLLNELMPQAVHIGESRLQKKSDEKIASEIGILRKTFLYRLKKTKRIIEREFPEYF